jgi:hypothetical protein
MPLRERKSPFNHSDFIFEVKLDRFRALALIEHGHAANLSQRPSVRFSAWNHASPCLALFWNHIFRKQFKPDQWSVSTRKAQGGAAKHYGLPRIKYHIAPDNRVFRVVA